MFGIEKRIARLGTSLSEAFNARARHYLTVCSDPSSGESQKRTAAIASLLLSDIASVIRDVTKVESERPEEV